MYSYSQIHDFTNDIGKDKCYIVFRFAAEAFKYSYKQYQEHRAKFKSLNI